MRAILDHIRGRRPRRRTTLSVGALAGALVLVFAGISIAKWERIEIYRVGDEPSSVAVGELTGDGINDIVIGNGLSSYVSLFKSRPDGLYNLPTKIRMGRPASAVGVGRFNKDKRRDVVAASDFGNRLMIRYGKRRGFKKTKTKKTGRAPAALAVGRIDGDRYDDVAVANSGDDTISIFKGSKKGLRRAGKIKVGGNAPTAIAIGDVGASGRRDIVTANARSRDISILLGKKGGLRKPKSVPVGPEPADVAIGQLGRGGGNDIAVVAAASSRFKILFGKKRGWLVRTFKGLKNAEAVDIGRIRGGKRADIVFGSSFRGKLAMYHRRGSGFRRGKVISLPGGPSAVLIAHLDFDPNRDIATANVDSFTASIVHQR